jgi:uncharacterized protein YaaR (DUF327 family)
MNIKSFVNETIKEHKNLIKTFMNDIIKEIYSEFINIEENNLTTTSIHKKIQLNELDTVKTNPNFFYNITLSHINYYDLNLNSINLNNFQSTINVSKIFQYIPKNYENSKITPFVLLKIDKNSLLKYKNDINDLEESYLNVKITFPLMEKCKLKLVKFKRDNFFYIILFFDCLTYNEPFIFNDYNEPFIFNDNTENNESNIFTNDILNNNSLNVNRFRENILSEEQIQTIRNRFQNRFENIFENRVENRLYFIEELIKEIGNNINLNYENIPDAVVDAMEKKLKIQKLYRNRSWYWWSGRIDKYWRIFWFNFIPICIFNYI